jgi:hypothetical protein
VEYVILWYWILFLGVYREALKPIFLSLNAFSQNFPIITQIKKIVTMPQDRLVLTIGVAIMIAFGMMLGVRNRAWRAVIIA